MEKIKKYLPMIILIILSVTLVAVTWVSRPFADFYVTYVFPKVTVPYSFLTSLVGFSVGEVMLTLVVFYLGLFFLYLVVLLVSWLFFKRTVLDRLGSFFIKVTPVLLTITVVVMSLNCFTLYHASKLQVRSDGRQEEYTVADLAALRDYVVSICNELSGEVPRDEKGNVAYTGDMRGTAIEAMRGLSDQYPRLSGFFTRPKALFFSGFMSQQYMQGYYFPFSMEANYNDLMNLTNKPFTMCHELAHTHGYIYEDEANFLGFRACISSEDIVFRYSGYLGVLNYINNDFYNSVSIEEYKSHVAISDEVKRDNEFLSKEAWEKVEKNAVLKTETVKKAADTFIDTNLKVNGVMEGKASYCNVVGLLLDYYRELDR